MRKLKTLSTLLLTLILTFAMSITTFAYNYKDYKTRPLSDGSGVLIKPNNPKAVNNVEFYLFVDEFVSDLHYSYYSFYCMGGEASEGITYLPLVYEFDYKSKTNIVDEIDNNDIVVMNFQLENGDYQFADNYNQSSHTNTLYALQSDFSFDDSIDGRTPEESVDDTEIITLKDGESIRIYAMIGYKASIQGYYETFKEWAMNKETELKERDAELEKLEQEKAALEETVEVEEPTLESTTVPTVEPASTPENVVTNSEERKDKNEEQIKDKDNDNGGLVGIIIGGIAGVGVLGGVGITLAKKRKK